MSSKVAFHEVRRCKYVITNNLIIEQSNFSKSLCGYFPKEPFRLLNLYGQTSQDSIQAKMSINDLFRVDCTSNLLSSCLFEEDIDDIIAENYSRYRNYPMLDNKITWCTRVEEKRCNDANEGGNNTNK